MKYVIECCRLEFSCHLLGNKKSNKQKQVFQSWSSSTVFILPFAFLIKLLHTPCKASTACHSARRRILAILDFIDYRCHTFQLMWFNMTMQEPMPGVIGDKLHYDITTRGDNYRIFTHCLVRGLNARRWCICPPIWCPCALGSVTFQIKRSIHDDTLRVVLTIANFYHVKTVSMEMNRVGNFNVCTY